MTENSVRAIAVDTTTSISATPAYYVTTNTSSYTIHHPTISLKDLAPLNFDSKDYCIKKQEYAETEIPKIKGKSDEYHLAFRFFSLLNRLPGDRAYRFISDTLGLDLETPEMLAFMYGELMKYEVER